MQFLLNKLEVGRENQRHLYSMYFAFLTSGMMSIILGALLPFLRSEGGLSYTLSGFLLSAHQIGNLGAVLLAGFLPYAIGRKRATLIMGAGIVAGMLLMTLTNNPALLIVAFVLTGISRGTMSNVCNVVVSEISGNKTGALNILHSLFAVGALVGPVLVLLYTQSLHVTWKAAAWTLAALGLVSWLNMAGLKLSPLPPYSKKDKRSGMPLFFWLSTLILFFYICAESTIIGWFVVYFEEAGLLSANLAKLAPTMLWFMIMLGRFACAGLSRRVDKNTLLLVLGAAFTLFFGGMLASKSAAACIVCILGAGFFMAGIYPTVLATLKNSSSAIDTGLCISLAATGGIIMPGIVGRVADSRGLPGGIATVLSALALMIVLMAVNFVIHRRARAAMTE